MNKRTGNPLHRRYLRELRGEFGKYAVIFVLLVFTIGLISGFLVADGSMITAYNESFEKYNIEDGNFRTDEEISSIRGCSELAHKAGLSIKLISGSEGNFKITTIEDLRSFKIILCSINNFAIC